MKAREANLIVYCVSWSRSHLAGAAFRKCKQMHGRI